MTDDEIRIPKPEIRINAEIRMTKRSLGKFDVELKRDGEKEMTNGLACN